MVNLLILFAKHWRRQKRARRLSSKGSFRPNSQALWCELIKDIAAIANSGGGVIVIGLENDGTPSGWDPTSFIATDPANVVNILAKYVGDQFDGFEISGSKKSNYRVATCGCRERHPSASRSQFVLVDETTEAVRSSQLIVTSGDEVDGGAGDIESGDAWSSDRCGRWLL